MVTGRSGLKSVGGASIAGFLLVVLLASGSCASGDSPIAPNEEAGGANSEPQPENVSFTLVAKDNTFQPDVIPALPGALVTVTLQNKGDLPHTFTIRDLDVDTGTVGPGKSDRVEFKAPEEDLPFICTFHEFEGQIGRLSPE